MALLGRWHLKPCIVIIAWMTLGSFLFFQWDALNVKNSDTAIPPTAVKKVAETSLLVETNRSRSPATGTLFSSKNSSHYIRQKKGQSKVSAKRQGVLGLFSEGTRPQEQQYCAGNVAIFNRVQVLLRNITLDPDKSHAKATGGVDPAEILKQSETDEEYRLSKGFLTVQCTSLAAPPNLADVLLASGGAAKHLKDYVNSVVFANGKDNGGRSGKIETRFTVALMRYEYANVYWTVMDLYDVYLIARFFNETPGDTRVLFTDARPQGHLDTLWGVFGSAVMLQEIKTTKTTFQKLAWRYGREHSPLLQQSARSLPELTAFRQFVLSNLGIIADERKRRDCDRLNVLYIWRRDYVAHPRNPSGLVGRKIRNEEELIRATTARFPKFQVRGVQLDKLPVIEQLRMISRADVYVGMHGAAMTFSLFLPPNSTVIELYPLSYGASSNWHMEMVAKWAGHRYYTWHNKDSALEDNKAMFTTVPTKVPIDFIEEARGHLCT